MTVSHMKSPILLVSAAAAGAGPLLRSLLGGDCLGPGLPHGLGEVDPAVEAELLPGHHHAAHPPAGLAAAR